MITKLSSKLIENLLKKNYISDEDKALYEYGIFMLLSYVVFFSVAIILGFGFNIPFFAILFFLSFCIVRNFAGGIHARSELKCNFFTTLLIIIGEILLKIFINYNLIEISSLLLVISSIVLCVMKPIASPEKEITQKEKEVFHKKLIVFLMFILVMSIGSMLIKCNNIAMSFSMGILLASFLFIAGKIQQLEKNNK